MNNLLLGLDIGSTTVKGVLVSPADNKILWSDYQRHETRQAEKTLELLSDIESKFPGVALRVFVTGSGGAAVAPLIGAKFVQEVNAVSLAIEHYFPDAGSVVELGGQDAKIIFWFVDEKTGKKRKLPSMNDKCAGGTGAVIDKIRSKLNITQEELASLQYDPNKLHPVAGKCGVFAETDINGLQKQGIAKNELMNSLFEALVQQNLSVLTRGNTLRPQVILLGGPNTFIPALQQAWKHNITALWNERKFPLPEGVDPASLVSVPENAQYFCALGCTLFGKSEEKSVGAYKGLKELKEYTGQGRVEIKLKLGEKGLSRSPEELEAFIAKYKTPSYKPANTSRSLKTIRGYLGVDAGSTSTKAVFIDTEGHVLSSAYQLSKGNPLADVKQVVASIIDNIKAGDNIGVEILGVGTTGYAKDMLKETIGADVAIVETVAHTQAALHFFPDADVIVDIGGQDIKVIMLKNGRVKDFKLNTQCSAGNGYFLQNTAEKFGIAVEDYAEHAFSAAVAPVFNFGCAVFLESDIVNFQQLGWEPKEIMAGLAQVLPKNIWLYVVQEPNLRKLGRNYILQGGTQRNLAAVKSQVDFISSRVPDANVQVHPYTGESGALGAALEARRIVKGASAFIGVEALFQLQFSSRRDESTRCHFCKNLCLRTFIDSKTPAGEERRFIVATCEKGTVEDTGSMKEIRAGLDKIKHDYPNFAEYAAKEAFHSPMPELIFQEEESMFFIKKSRKHILQKRANIRIGIPRVLNMYSVAPLFNAYFESLGVPHKHLIYSDFTSEKLYKDGSRRGAIDPCFPSKVALAHVHQLLYKKKVDAIFFPCIMDMKTEITNTLAHYACPTVSASPEVAKAAFTKEADIFAQKGVQYLNPVLNMGEPELMEKQMFEVFGDVLGLTRHESLRAIEEGYRAMGEFYATMRSKARDTLSSLEKEKRLGILLLGRPYHNDPGLNHGILDELQKAGYPIFTIDSLPQDTATLERLFGMEMREGYIQSPMDIYDVWKNSLSENSNKKIWGAKYAARHPNIVALDLSNFKCGHDATVYHVVESIVEATGTPYFTFHEIDENKPSGSIKIRVETIRYFLKRYEEEMLRPGTSGIMIENTDESLPELTYIT